MGNEFSWKRLTAEGAVIVLSILLAFSLDAWWEAHTERSQALDAVVALGTDFEAARSELAGQVRTNEGILASSDSLLSLLEGGSVVDVPTDLLISLTRASTYAPPTGALDELLASGRLSMIPDGELREALAAWPVTVERLNEKMNLHESFVFEQLIPEMRSIMPFRVVADTRYEEAQRPEAIPVHSTEEFANLLSQLRIMVHRTLKSSGGVGRVDDLLSVIEARLSETR